MWWSLNYSEGRQLSLSYNIFSPIVILLPSNALSNAGTVQQQKSKSRNCIFKNRKIASAERQSRKQILWGPLIRQFPIHYEDFSFLFRGESAPFDVTAPFTPFSEMTEAKVSNNRYAGGTCGKKLTTQGTKAGS